MPEVTQQRRMQTRSLDSSGGPHPPPFPEAPYPLQAVRSDLVKCHLTQLASRVGLNRG